MTEGPSDPQALLLQLHAIRSAMSVEARAEYETWRPGIERIAALPRATGEPDPPPYPTSALFFAGQAALGAAAEELFGAPADGRTVRIMCAHDDARTWRAMAANTRAAANELAMTCPIQVDIAGPKLRVEAVRVSGHHADPEPRVHIGDRVLLISTLRSLPWPTY